MRNWIYAAGIVLLLGLAVFVAMPAVSDHLNDQAYLTTWGQSQAELSPLHTSCYSTAKTYDNTGTYGNYIESGKMATNLSIRAKYWYGKLQTMPISSAMRETQNAQLQALTEEVAFADAWAAGMPKLVGKKSVVFSDLIESVPDLREAKDHIALKGQYLDRANASLPK